MSIKKDIEILINSISSIEDRHLLELIAVYDGLKDVMRIHINFHNIEEIFIIGLSLGESDIEYFKIINN